MKVREVGEKLEVVTALRKAFVVDKHGCCSWSTKDLVVSAGRFRDENSKRDSAKMLVRNTTALFYLGRVSVSHSPLGALSPASCGGCGSCWSSVQL